MRKLATLSFTLAVCLAAGCRRQEQNSDPLSAMLSRHEERLSRLEESNSRLIAKIDSFMEAQEQESSTDGVVVPASLPVGDASSVLSENLADILEDRVKEIVEGTLNERIGDQQTIQAVFEEVVEEEISAREERKQQEEEDEQQRRRDERERERAEREDQQFAAFAEVLGLDDEQMLKVKTISDETRDTIRQAMSEMREDGRFTPRDYHETFDHIRSNRNEVIRQTLSEEQYNLFMKEYDGRLVGFGGRGFRGGGRR